VLAPMGVPDAHDFPWSSYHIWKRAPPVRRCLGPSCDVAGRANRELLDVAAEHGMFVLF